MPEFGSKPSEKEWTLYACPRCNRVWPTDKRNGLSLRCTCHPDGRSPFVERVRVAPAEKLLRCAQALRLIRDSTSGYPANVASRALEEAGVDDPPDGVLGCSGRPEKETG
jgi:hypothetical protein